MTVKRVFPRLGRQARRCPAITLFLAALLAAMPAAAQQTAPAPATATGETAGLNAQDLNGLADRLQNPDERQKLVDTLRALAAARDSADGKPADGKPAPPEAADTDPGSAIVDGVMAPMRRAGSTLAAARDRKSTRLNSSH